MKWNRKDLWMVLIGLIPFLVGVLKYKELPERMATHFGSAGNVNGTMQRPAALAVLALLGIGIPLITKLSRKMDPKRDNFGKFEGAYGIIRWAVTIMVTLSGLFLVLYNLGYDMKPAWLTSLMIGLLIMVLGNYMGQIRFNYTVGIRTPWTLSNETVWRKTHRMAAPVWVLGGIVIILSGLADGTLGTGLKLAAIALLVLIPVGYSYWLHRNLRE